MTQIEDPKVVRKKLFSPVWLLPLVALALAGWLGIKSIRESGVEISIHFPSATGIDVGKTLVKYQGLTVGKVSDITMDDELKGVNVTVTMDYRSSRYLREHTEFWLVSPKASITGVSGLDALFSGNYIAVQPGGGNSATKFEALREAPLLAPGNEGILVELTTDKLRSLDVGSTVYFRQIPVGNVISYRLEGHQKIVIGAFIEQQYAHLVKKDSRFWNVSGVNIDASLQGIKVESESLASLLAGGISFSSSMDSDNAIHGDHFVLFDSQSDALDGQKITLTAAEADGIDIGTAVIYRGLEVGKVSHRELTNSGVNIQLVINQAQANLIGTNSRFWREGAKLSLSGVKHAARLLTGDVIALLPGEGSPLATYPLEDKAPDFMSAEKGHVIIRSHSGVAAKVGSEIRYRNLPIGKIVDMRLAKDLSSVEYRGEIEPEFRRLLTKGSFLIPESAFSLDASLTGVKLAVGDTDVLLKGALRYFRGSGEILGKEPELSLYPSMDALEEARKLQGQILVSLTSQDGAGIEARSPVYYKKMQIGEVKSVKWLSDSDSFSITLAIEKAFSNLIGPKTLYWKRSAVSMQASLKGLQLDIASLPGLLSGGIGVSLLSDTRVQHPDYLYDSESLALSQAYPIELSLSAEARLAAGAPIQYQGHQVGEVSDVMLTGDLTNLIARAYLYGKYADQFSRQDSIYILEDTEISLQGIKRPEALLTGPFISVVPGKSAGLVRRFEVKQQADHYAYLPDGALKITLERPNLGSVKAGSQIFYRGVAIGRIDGYALSEEGNKVQLYAHIDRKYRKLVNASSVFFDLSGVNFEFGIFSGAKLDTGSLETILAGGIGVATRDISNDQNLVPDGVIFSLYPRAESDWLAWKPQ